MSFKDELKQKVKQIELILTECLPRGEGYLKQNAEMFV